MFVLSFWRAYPFSILAHTQRRKANSLRSAAFSCYSNKPPALARGRWRWTQVVCFYPTSVLLQQRVYEWALQSAREKIDCLEVDSKNVTHSPITVAIPQNLSDLKLYNRCPKFLHSRQHFDLIAWEKLGTTRTHTHSLHGPFSSSFFSLCCLWARLTAYRLHGQQIKF